VDRATEQCARRALVRHGAATEEKDMQDAKTRPSNVSETIIPFEQVETQLRTKAGREDLPRGLGERPAQWYDPNPQQFTREQRGHTTLLFGGLTAVHDRLIEAGLASLGYKARALPCPDNASLQAGKEFGNRGQCNPTYFTVGNLIKYLVYLRDVEGQPTEEIIKNHVFVTVGACGPCRFGSYITEYRKALRDAGFDGFRVLLFQNSAGIKQSSSDAGLALTPKFFITFLKCIVAGDVLNTMGYRIRPYEAVPGSTNAALERCQAIVSEALRGGRSAWRALRRCRKVFKRIAVNRLQAKPKVAIIGEFWAMTTEGDGNYRLQQFLEAEGAECDIQLITNWALYSLWELQYDTREHMLLQRRAHEVQAVQDEAPVKKLFLLRLGRFLLERSFYSLARAVGLRDYHLADMDELAAISHPYYPNQLRGGEGHMEVGKVIQAVTHKKAHMVISVKPFGCMPSSGVSDGVQSLVTARYPEANFLAVETSGDGAVNVHSRVQMVLFKARKKAQEEFDAALGRVDTDRDAALRKLSAKVWLKDALRYPRHSVAGTAANAVYEAIN